MSDHLYEYVGRKYSNGTFTDIDPNGLQHISCSDFEQFKGEVTEEMKTKLYIQPELMSGSDYSGGAAEKSNQRSFLKEYGKREGVHEIYGGYGTYGVAIRLDVSEQEDIAATLNAFEDYCVLDDEDHSALEQELIDESWKDSVERDVRKAIERELEDKLPDIEDILDNMELRDLFEQVREEVNEYWVIESGCSVYIKTDKIIHIMTIRVLLQNMKAEDLPTLIGSDWHNVETRNLFEAHLKGEQV